MEKKLIEHIELAKKNGISMFLLEGLTDELYSDADYYKDYAKQHGCSVRTVADSVNGVMLEVKYNN